MRPPLSSKFLEKAEAALISAVEVYNKPGFRYREETFSLLAINAWELLLKAQLLRLNGNDPRSIRVYEPRRTKAGVPSKKLYLRRNRAGSPLTKSLGACIATLDRAESTRLDAAVRGNLDGLVAVRDGAAHYIHASAILRRQVLELACACVKNFVLSSREWFQRDLSDSLSLVLPLSFVDGRVELESVVVTRGEDRLSRYLQGLASSHTPPDSPFAVAIRVDVRLARSALNTSSRVQVTNDPDAVRVFLTEADVRDRYPWDYAELVKQCALRYEGFKQDAQFHSLRKPLRGDARFVHSRYLDPRNLKSGRKDFYSRDVLQVLDKAYPRRGRTAS